MQKNPIKKSGLCYLSSVDITVGDFKKYIIIFGIKKMTMTMTMNANQKKPYKQNKNSFILSRTVRKFISGLESPGQMESFLFAIKKQ